MPLSEKALHRMSEVLGAEFNERAKRTLQAMADVVLEEVAKPQCVFCRRGGKAVPGEVAPHLGSLVHHEVGPMTYVCKAQEIHRLKGAGERPGMETGGHR